MSVLGNFNCSLLKDTSNALTQTQTAIWKYITWFKQ